MRRRRWPELLMTVLAGTAVAARATAAESDLGAPSVCAPPCPDGEICVGNRCVPPTGQSRATTPSPPRPLEPPPLPGSAPTTGPQPSPVPDATHPSSTATAPTGPAPPGPTAPPGSAAPGPSPPPLLRHDGDPWGGKAYTPSNTRVKRGFLALPFVGIHSYAQEEAAAYQPGLRFGALLGGRLTGRWSLNGELIVDVSNVQGAPAPFRERAYHFIFSPLYDVDAGAVQLVFGPKLGTFVLRTEQGVTDVVVASQVVGFSAGLNGGVFLPIAARTSIGVLLSFDFAGANQGCTRATDPFFSSCGSEAAHGGKVVGLTGGVLF